MMNLKAIELGGEVVVKDIEDGFSMWTPSGEAAEQIAASNDPQAEAVKICKTEPMRGKWSN